MGAAAPHHDLVRQSCRSAPIRNLFPAMVRRHFRRAGGGLKSDVLAPCTLRSFFFEVDVRKTFFIVAIHKTPQQNEHALDACRSMAATFCLVDARAFDSGELSWLAGKWL